jgi:hypothetical protein
MKLKINKLKKHIVIIQNIIGVCLLGICLLGLLPSCGGGEGGGGCNWTTIDANFSQIRLRPPAFSASLRYIDKCNVEPILMTDFSSLFYYTCRTKTSIKVSVTITTGCPTIKSERTYSVDSNWNEVSTYGLKNIPITGLSSQQHSITISIKSGPFYMNGSHPGYIFWERKLDTDPIAALNGILDIQGKFVPDDSYSNTMGIIHPKKIYIDGAFVIK